MLSSVRETASGRSPARRTRSSVQASSFTNRLQKPTKQNPLGVYQKMQAVTRSNERLPRNGSQSMISLNAQSHSSHPMHFVPEFVKKAKKTSRPHSAHRKTTRKISRGAFFSSVPAYTKVPSTTTNTTLNFSVGPDEKQDFLKMR